MFETEVSDVERRPDPGGGRLQEFEQESSLKEHVYMHKEGGNFTCLHCQKTFTEYPNTRKHIGHIQEEKRLSYTVCTKSFNGRDKFKTHLARHSEATDFMCEDCDEQCKRKDKLGDHGKRMHKEGGNFTSPHCHKTFTEYPNIRKHIGHIHEEEMFFCTVCTKSFTGRDKFKTHLVRHSEATDFTCDDCGEQCKRKDKLREHGKRMHNVPRKKERPVVGQGVQGDR